MATSSLLGIDRSDPGAPGRDTASLGPSDTSDTGSDIVGAEDLDNGDPGLPVDVALSDDRMHPDSSADPSILAGDSDAAGTGERRSAAGDGGLREAADIGVDRIVSDPNATALQDEAEVLDGLSLEDEELDALEQTAQADASDSDEDEDEDEDDTLDGFADAPLEDEASVLQNEDADPVGGRRTPR